MTRAELLAWNEGRTQLGRLTTLVEVGRAAAFLASDHAGAVTAAGMNLTCGAVPTR
jgi:enoyl-[acyl-carrier-protein] reductase (NADH)